MTIVSSTPPVVEATDISKSFGSRIAVNSVHLSVRAGEWVAVFGGNGEGKTTLLRLLSLSLVPTAGGLQLWGRPAETDPANHRARIGVLSHALRLYPDLTCRENLEYFARLHGVSNPAVRSEEWLDRFGLTARTDDRVCELSRGLQQRLSLARSVLHQPELLFLDEPFTGLDPAAAGLLDELLADWRRAGTTCILVTHRLEKGLAAADRWMLMRRGRTVAEGVSRETDPSELEREFLASAQAMAR